MKDVRILGVDLGKNSCSVVGLDGAGRVLLRRRTRREEVIALAAKLPGCVVAMEQVLRSPSPRAPSGGPGTRGAADVARVRPALRQGSEER